MFGKLTTLIIRLFCNRNFVFLSLIFFLILWFINGKAVIKTMTGTETAEDYAVRKIEKMRRIDPQLANFLAKTKAETDAAALAASLKGCEVQYGLSALRKFVEDYSKNGNSTYYRAMQLANRNDLNYSKGERDAFLVSHGTAIQLLEFV